MRHVVGTIAIAATLGVGFAAGRARPAIAVDEHAGHDMIAMSISPSQQQGAAIPPGATGAADRLAK